MRWWRDAGDEEEAEYEAVVADAGKKEMRKWRNVFGRCIWVRTCAKTGADPWTWKIRAL